MKKTNRSTTMRFASVLVLVCMLVTCAVAGTLAKYTSSATSTADVVNVASWKFTVEGTDIATSDTFTANLFDTILDSDYTSAETEVKAGLIAPGTSGQIELNIANLSEVDAKYAMDFSVVNEDNVPIEFSLVGGADATDWTLDIDDLDIAESAEVAMETGTSTVTLYWRWVFSGNDTADTALGVAAAAGDTPSVTVTVKVTANQVD